MSTFTELSDDIIILIGKYYVSPLALIIASKKIYNLLNKKQLHTKNTMTITYYTVIEKMVIQDYKYVVIRSIRKRIRKLKPIIIYVYWFEKVNVRNCGCKHKDIYELNKGNIINKSSNRLIECNEHAYIRGIPDLDTAIASIIEKNMFSSYARHTNYALEY